MKSIQVFESANLNKKGLNVAEMNQQLISFADDVTWAEQNNIQIERFTFEQQPMAFANNQLVKDFIASSGLERLPLILVDSDLILSGRYPNRNELSIWAGLFQPAIEIKPSTGCCSGGKCG
jgi:hypothetical protein